jgi:PPP family 3-phenylpropionic acid transporter
MTSSETLSAARGTINPLAVRRTAVAFFFNFMVGGLMGPFLSPVLMARGLSHSEIGLTFAAIYGCGTLMPLVMGHIADSYVSLGRAIRTACAGLVACAALLWAIATWQPDAVGAQSSTLFVSVLLLLALSRAPLGSLLDTLAMQVAHNQAPVYARIRLCGSLAYMSAATGAGYLLSCGHLHRFFGALTLLATLACVTGWLLPQERRSAERLQEDRLHAATNKFRRTLTPTFWLWMAAMMLHWLAFTPYQYGFSLYLREQHVTSEVTGLLWSVGVLAEMATFATCHHFFKRIPMARALALTFAAGALRWALLGNFTHIGIIAVSQLLHGPSFALFYSACMQELSVFGGVRYRSSYQGLFATLVTGLSACLGTAVAGQLHSHMPFQRVILLGIPFEVAAAVMLWRSSISRARHAV